MGKARSIQSNALPSDCPTNAGQFEFVDQNVGRLSHHRVVFVQHKGLTGGESRMKESVSIRDLQLFNLKTVMAEERKSGKDV